MAGSLPTKKQKSKTETWIKFRHKIVWAILAPVFDVMCKFIYGAHIERFSEYDKRMGNTGDKLIAGRPCIILFNHVTGFDQFFVGVSYRKPIYFVATEDIFSMGFLSGIIKFLGAPIPIKKYTTDLNALKIMFKVVKEGGTISIAPEGNRTYSGRTCEMKDAISGLCKKLGIPIVIFKIEGGYGVQPRWSDKIRKGRLTGRVETVLYPEDIKDIRPPELFKMIKDLLYLDEARDSFTYTCRNSAEYIERALYVCPDCGFSRFESCKDTVTCLSCGMKVKYNDDTSLTGVTRPFRFNYFADWYDFQREFINGTNLTELTKAPVFTDNVKLYKVIPYKNKHLEDKDVRMQLYGDRIVLDKSVSSEPECISFSNVTGIACMGKNKLNINIGDTVYQIKGCKRFNALKYVNFNYRYNNITKGNEGNEQFLGL